MYFWNFLYQLFFTWYDKKICVKNKSNFSNEYLLNKKLYLMGWSVNEIQLSQKRGPLTAKEPSALSYLYSTFLL
jgi:hypothetical protein